MAIVEASGDLDSLEFKVEENLIHSQISTHKKWGGVVPNLAKNEHLEKLPELYEKVKDYDIDLIAVTAGPGLAPALWAGINYAEELGKKLNKPVAGANHLEGHFYSFLLCPNQEFKFPSIGLLVSGGHTLLALFESLTEFRYIGTTKDDAIGEVFDKVARMISLPYPGGPEIDRLAKQGDIKAYDLPRPMLNDPSFDFSFSGIKTAVLYLLRDAGYYDMDGISPNAKLNKEIPDSVKADISASFQEAITEVLVKKTMRATEEFGARSVFLGGGVAANTYLKKHLQDTAEEHGLQFLSPSNEFNTDNAAMIAVGAYINHLTGKKYKLEAQPNLKIESL